MNRIAMALVAALLFAGCGGSDLRDEAIGDAAKTLPFSYTKPAGGKGSAADAVMSMLHASSVGATPEVPEYFSDSARQALGPAVIAGVMLAQRTALLGDAPSVLGTRNYGDGAVVSVRFPTPVVGSLQHGFFLRRESGRWAIVYDTLIAAAVGTYVQGEVQTRVAPGAAAPDPRALRAGTRAQNIYRASAVVDAEDGTVQQIITASLGADGADESATPTPTPRRSPTATATPTP